MVLDVVHLAMVVVLLAVGTGFALFLLGVYIHESRHKRTILGHLLADLERNAYLLTPLEESRQQGTPVRRIEMEWLRANLETEAWWAHRADLRFLPEGLERRLRYFVFQLDDVNRKIAGLRYLGSNTNGNLVRERVGSGILGHLESSNRSVYLDLKEQMRHL